MRRINRGATGLTLVELLAATTMTLLLLAAVGGFARAHGAVMTRQLAALDLREAARRALEITAREIRGAGFDPEPGPFDGAADGLSVAAAERIELESDLHGATGAGPPDGILDPTSDEHISFYRGASRDVFYEAVGGQVLPLTAPGSMLPGDLLFRYFDRCDLELIPPPGGQLSAIERSSVRQVSIALTLRDATGDTARAATTAMLRNRSSLRCP